jgi:3-phenylpropionate/trans-cinnamate dioxygenase ferredoxin reductase subunit
MSNEEKSYDYVIVGAGVAAASAVKGIRSGDTSGSIAVLGSEPHKPVYRPDLSKALWLEDDKTLEGSSLAGDLDADDAVDLLTETTVTAIDPGAHVVRLADGSSVGYGKLLLATGAEPRVLAVDPGPRVIY